jgi:hypothetical protein
MNIIKTVKLLYKAKDPHFLSISKEQWKRWGLLIKITLLFNKNYKHCTIYRSEYKFLNDIVVVGLKWNGRNVKRRTSGFAKEFLSNNKNKKCIYCDSKLTPENATTDHIIPISKGGNNAQVNLIICCFDCNNERGDLDFIDYLRIKNPKYKNIRTPYI